MLGPTHWTASTFLLNFFGKSSFEKTARRMRSSKRSVVVSASAAFTSTYPVVIIRCLSNTDFRMPSGRHLPELSSVRLSHTNSLSNSGWCKRFDKTASRYFVVSSNSPTGDNSVKFSSFVSSPINTCTTYPSSSLASSQILFSLVISSLRLLFWFTSTKTDISCAKRLPSNCVNESRVSDTKSSNSNVASTWYSASFGQGCPFSSSTIFSRASICWIWHRKSKTCVLASFLHWATYVLFEPLRSYRKVCGFFRSWFLNFQK